MPLALNEIAVGVVAYFDPALLLADAQVARPAVPVTRSGPFACVQCVAGRSVWSPITTQFRRERLEILPAWRAEGSVQWRTDTLYLNDGANTYVGPSASFVNAAVAETPFTVINRPCITAQGVAAIMAAITLRRGNVLYPSFQRTAFGGR